jgi:hypothetical protein
MCMMASRRCFCGRKLAYLNFRDNLLSPEILVNLYCPECGPETAFDPATMVADCGWIMEYDMEGARALFLKQNLDRGITPEVIFDEGYLTWQGFPPGDHELRAELRQRLAPLIKGDMSQYVQTPKDEWLAHVERLKAAGWRRAQQA